MASALREEAALAALLQRMTAAKLAEHDLKRLEEDAVEYAAKASTNERALNELTYGKGKPTDSTYVCLGNYFAKVPRQKAEHLLRRNQAELRQKQVAGKAAIAKRKKELAVLLDGNKTKG